MFTRRRAAEQADELDIAILGDESDLLLAHSARELEHDIGELGAMREARAHGVFLIHLRAACSTATPDLPVARSLTPTIGKP